MPRQKKSQTIGRRNALKERIQWINVENPTTASLMKLKERFPFFLDIDLKDCLPPFQRPKLLERERYLFLVLLFPVYDAEKRGIHPYEVDFFIGKDFLVTSHAGTHEAIATLTGDCTGDDDHCLLQTATDPLRLAHDVIHGLTVSCFPISTVIGNDLIRIEERLFKRDDRDLVREILRVRSNILTFRKTLQGHESSFDRLLDRGKKLFEIDHLRASYEDVRAHGREIRDFLNNDKDTVDALYDSHLSLISHRTGEEIKTLTALAFVIFPATLIAAIFAMRAEHMPLLGLPNDFWLMVGVIVGTMVGLVLFMKWKRWL